MGPLDLLHSYEKGFWIVNDSDLVWGSIWKLSVVWVYIETLKVHPVGQTKELYRKFTVETG